MFYQHRTLTIYILLISCLSLISNHALANKQNKKSTSPQTPTLLTVSGDYQLLEQFQKEAEPISKEMQALADKCMKNDLTSCDRLQEKTTAILHLTCKYKVDPSSCKLAENRQKQADACRKSSTPLHKCYENVEEKTGKNK